MAHLGLVPREDSSADRMRRGGLTKAGNAEARRVPVEAAWCYRLLDQVRNSPRNRGNSNPPTGRPPRIPLGSGSPQMPRQEGDAALQAGVVDAVAEARP